jgi:hypothetical protein
MVLNSAVALPTKWHVKRIKKRNLSEPKASLFRFPLGMPLCREPEGQRLCLAGAVLQPFFAYFFGEAKK